MKLVSTSVRPESVGRVVDMLRTLGYTHCGVEPDPQVANAMLVEVLVKEVDAPRAAVALSRVTSKDPHPVFVTDLASLELAGVAAAG